MPRKQTPHRPALKKQKCVSKNGETFAEEKREYPLSFGRLLSRWHGRRGLIEPHGSCMWRGTIYEKRRMPATGAVPQQPAFVELYGHAGGAIGSRMHA